MQQSESQLLNLMSTDPNTEPAPRTAQGGDQVNSTSEFNYANEARNIATRRESSDPAVRPTATD